jgi:hypothetical protein
MAWFSNPLRSDSGDVVQPGTSDDYSRQTLYGHERDDADKLAPVPREKFTRLRAEASDARAMRLVPYAAMKESTEKARQVDARIRDLTVRHGYAETHPLVVAERKSLDAFNSEARRLSDEYQRRQAASESLLQLVQRLEAYVGTLPAGVAAAPPIAPKLAKGETPVQAAERTRAELAKLRDELFDAENAPLPSVDAKRIARRQIEAMAAAGRPNALELLEGRSKFSFAKTRGPRIQVSSSGDRSQAIADDVFDSESTFAWLHRDALIAAVEAAIDQDADDSSALSDEVRAQRLAETKAKILEAERLEEAFIVAAQEAGVTIARRSDVDPRAVLGLADSAPAPNRE